LAGDVLCDENRSETVYEALLENIGEQVGAEFFAPSPLLKTLALEARGFYSK